MEVTKNEILKRISMNMDISSRDFENLSFEDKKEVEATICNEIYNKNSKYYKYIPYLESIDLPKLMSTGFISGIKNENDRLLLITYIYIKNPKPDTLEYLILKTKDSEYGLSLLEEILKFYPQYEFLKKFLNNQRNNISGKNIAKEHYYLMDKSIIIKINNDDCTLYVFDTKQKKWRLDPELYGEYAYGVLHLSPIEFNDVYPIGDPLDLSKGKKL